MTTMTRSSQEKLREEIKEKLFEAGDRLLRPIRQVLNEVYPLSKRMERSPSFDPAVLEEHDKKFRTARNILYEQRNLIQRVHLPKYVVRIGDDESLATKEMRQLVVDGCFDRVYEGLIAYLPMLLPADKREATMETIKNLYESEARQLSKAMTRYAASFAPGRRSADEELD